MQAIIKKILNYIRFIIKIHLFINVMYNINNCVLGTFLLED